MNPEDDPIPNVLREINQEQGLAAVVSRCRAYLEPTIAAGATRPPVCRTRQFVPAYGERQWPAFGRPGGSPQWTRHASVGPRNTVAYRRVVNEGMGEDEAAVKAIRNRVDPTAVVAFEPIDPVALALLPREPAACDH
ncbi:hypothetical protein [Kutzneria sp. 744]|uniref:hypothetical protein n=1 Tax=Kutzneria sp. (strain 744) TaxID=345341 RepID=UPI0003EEC48E|nr:hypothetical protein [Kutzneria sp. 744]EWM19626.1 hypothetical protein KUTG_09930 [Kutzneria sp. 744]